MRNSYDHSGGGSGSYPSVGDRTAYASRKDAIAGVIEELAEQFQEVRRWREALARGLA